MVAARMRHHGNAVMQCCLTWLGESRVVDMLKQTVGKGNVRAAAEIPKVYKVYGPVEPFR
jgi:hypothetical protein